MAELTPLWAEVKVIYNKIMGIKPVLNENEMIISNLKEVNSKIARSETMFNELTDQDLIDYATYDILAEKARFSHLIKQAKKRNLHF